MASYSCRDISLIPSLTFAFVEKYTKDKKCSSGNKSIDKGFKFYSESYIHELKVIQSTVGCKITGRCHKSQRKSEAPYKLEVHLTTTDGEPEVTKALCECPIGLSQSCGHVTGLLYQLAHFKSVGLKALPEDVAKTSLPQTFHLPRGEKIAGKRVQDLNVSGYSKVTEVEGGTPAKTIKSTLYNPLRSEPINWTACHSKLKEVATDALILPSIEEQASQMVPSKFGQVPYGSLLSYQQKTHAECIINILDGVGFPDLPIKNCMSKDFQTVLSQEHQTKCNGIRLSLADVHKFERLTREQSESPLWHRIRKHRLTASQIGRIYKRRKDAESLAKQLKSTRHVTTAAMRRGLACEPKAASKYANTLGDNVNLFPSGIVISYWAPWIAASPDRKVYNPSRMPPFGLLEVKCPQVASVLETKYLVKDATGALKLKRNHDYYYQVLTQLAVTGLEWCDFFVWCENDFHSETVYFNRDTWDIVKMKLDQFFFEHML